VLLQIRSLKLLTDEDYSSIIVVSHVEELFLTKGEFYTKEGIALALTTRGIL
jgi:hypothetical protein